MVDGLILKDNMKILLIGKNGQLGQEIDKQARIKSYQISSFGREELDIADGKRVKSEIESFNPDVVINTSAFHVVPLCEDQPEQAFLVNTISLKPIAEICANKNIKFVTYSTDYVFDGSKGIPYEETDAPNPLQIYGLSKLAGEFVALNYSKTSIVIRTCGVYGGAQGSRSKKGNFILNILKQAETENIIEVSSEQIVSPTYSCDLAKATLDILGNGKVSGIYHLVNEGYCSWAEFASEAIKIKALPVKIIPVNKKGMAGLLRRPLFSALKNLKAANLGVKLPSWKDALKRYLEAI
jgi:dTDP-4-dehydrorhamnose reductase